MITDTRKAFVVAALIVAIGMVGVELTRSVAQADSSDLPGSPSYAGARIDAAFEVAAERPQVAEVSVPMASKGDLEIPFGCVGVQTDLQNECTNTAYSVLTEPSFVVANTFGNTTTLMRIDAMAVANVIGDVFGTVDEAAVSQ
jgi:hypothetical protein